MSIIKSRDESIQILKDTVKLLKDNEEYLKTLIFDHDLQEAANELILNLNIAAEDSTAVLLLEDSYDIENRKDEKDYRRYTNDIYHEDRL